MFECGWSRRKGGDSRAGSLDPSLLSSARGRADKVVVDVEVLIMMIQLSGLQSISSLLTKAAASTMSLGTSNFHPAREGRIAALDDGQVESIWVSEHLRKPVAKGGTRSTRCPFREGHGGRHHGPYCQTL